MIVQNAKRDAEHQPRVAAKQQIQSLCILRLDSSHQFFIRRRPNPDRLRRRDSALPARAKDDRKCQRAAIRGSAHSRTWRTDVPAEIPANLAAMSKTSGGQIMNADRASREYAQAYIRPSQVF